MQLSAKVLIMVFLLKVEVQQQVLGLLHRLDYLMLVEVTRIHMIWQLNKVCLAEVLVPE